MSDTATGAEKCRCEDACGHGELTLTLSRSHLQPESRPELIVHAWAYGTIWGLASLGLASSESAVRPNRSVTFWEVRCKATRRGPGTKERAGTSPAFAIAALMRLELSLRWCSLEGAPS